MVFEIGKISKEELERRKARIGAYYWLCGIPRVPGWAVRRHTIVFTYRVTVRIIDKRYNAVVDEFEVYDKNKINTSFAAFVRLLDKILRAKARITIYNILQESPLPPDYEARGVAAQLLQVFIFPLHTAISLADLYAQAAAI